MSEYSINSPKRISATGLYSSEIEELKSLDTKSKVEVKIAGPGIYVDIYDIDDYDTVINYLNSVNAEISEGKLKPLLSLIESVIKNTIYEHEILNEENELLKASKKVRWFNATKDDRTLEENERILIEIIRDFAEQFAEIEEKFAEIIKDSLPKKGWKRDFVFLHNLKPEKSIVDKALKRGKNILEMSDLVRGALLFKNKFDIKDWVDDFRRKYSQHIDKYEFKEKGSDKVFDYHGSHHIDLKINGLTVELQVMSAKLWKYKEPAHDIYNRWRSSPISPPEVEKNMSRAFFRMGNESIESTSDKLSRIVELMVERELRRT